MIIDEIKILKTSCRGCIFDKANCLLGHNNFVDATKNNINEKWMKGYCHDKRSKKWLELNNNNITQATKEMLYNNNDDVTVVIIFDESTVESLHNTIESLLNLDKINFNHFVIVVKQSSRRVLKQIIQLVPKMILNKKWSVEQFIDAQEIPVDYYLMDWCKRHVKTTWFLTLFSGDTISYKQDYVDIFQHDNSVAYYFDEHDPIRIFFHKQVFHELEGNAEQPCIDKIKSFDNWREVCHQVKSKLQLLHHVSDMENGSEDTLTLYSIKK